MARLRLSGGAVPVGRSQDLLLEHRSSDSRGRGVHRGSLTQLDPPRHTKLRKLVSQAFTPKVVAGSRTSHRTVATDLLEAAAPDRIDLVADLAYPLPVIVIAELLGVPSSDRDLFKQWVDTMLSQLRPSSRWTSAAKVRNRSARNPCVR